MLELQTGYLSEWLESGSCLCAQSDGERQERGARLYPDGKARENATHPAETGCPENRRVVAPEMRSRRYRSIVDGSVLSSVLGKQTSVLCICPTHIMKTICRPCCIAWRRCEGNT